MKDNNALSPLVKRFSIMSAMLVLAQSVVQAQPVLPATASAPKFRALALAESGGHHVEFTKAAKPLLTKCGDEDGFEVDYITNTVSITETFLARYRLVLQLDFVPYGWTPEAMAAFKAYIEEDRGGWVGLHHATLLGDFDVCCFSWNWKNGRFELHSQGRTKGPELWKSPDDSSPAWRR